MDKKTLLALDPEEFNQYRRNNDLPRLFYFFKDYLPCFEVWLDEFEIVLEDFVLAPHTGRWFFGEGSKTFYEYEHHGKINYIICGDFETDVGKSLGIRYSEWIKSQKAFVPYIFWAKSRLKTSKPIPGSGGRHNVDTFQYNRFGDFGASLFGEHTVLDLSYCEIKGYKKLYDRNLDFVCLDGCTICEYSGGSSAAEINYSSLQTVQIIKSTMTFFQFNGSNIQDLDIRDSYIQDMGFYGCDLHGLKVSDSEFMNIDIHFCMFSNPVFRGSQLRQVSYIPYTKNLHLIAAQHASMRLRNALQSCGNSTEAQELFYLQKNFERKALWHAEIYNRKKFPKCTYSGSFSDLKDQWAQGYFSHSIASKYLVSKLKYHAMCWLYPRYFYKSISYKLKYLLSLAGYLVWGYGLRPLRVALFGMIVIGIFSILFCMYGPETTRSNIWNSTYFSVVTFTTLGYGDIQPTNVWIKLACALEALLGATTIGLGIGAVSRKVSY